MRFVVLDTETTGLNPDEDRVFEIGCCEIISRKETGREFHMIIDPEREISEQVSTICKKTTADVKGKKKFADILDELLNFLHTTSTGEKSHSVLVAHNAKFDINFLNSEIKRTGRNEDIIKFVSTYPETGELESFFVLDTVKMAKIRYPGKSVKLDNICEMLDIDLHERESKGHGALLDSRLLCKVFLAFLNQENDDYIRTFDKKAKTFFGFASQQNFISTSNFTLSSEEIAMHNEILLSLGLDNLW